MQYGNRLECFLPDGLSYSYELDKMKLMFLKSFRGRGKRLLWDLLWHRRHRGSPEKRGRCTCSYEELVSTQCSSRLGKIHDHLTTSLGYNKKDSTSVSESLINLFLRSPDLIGRFKGRTSGILRVRVTVTLPDRLTEMSFSCPSHFWNAGRVLELETYISTTRAEGRNSFSSIR